MSITQTELNSLAVEASCPTVFNLEDESYAKCTRLEVFMDIYWSTAVVRMVGQWKPSIISVCCLVNPK